MEKYYLGLDIGTNTIGWAVTDENYKLLRRKGKDLWGVRFFKEAQTAAERRVHRSNRNRLIRRKQRQQIIRELFEEEINKVDKEFFNRLDESRYWEEDKKMTSKNSLFNDKNFTDKDYYEKYPTIFHLRKALIEGNTNEDIRLYFLAINQMMKRRGHFLIDGNLGAVKDFNPILEKLYSTANELSEEDIEFEIIEEIFKVVNDTETRKTEKKNSIKQLLATYEISKRTERYLTSISTLLISGKVSAKDFINNDERFKYFTSEGKKDFVFSSEKYEEDLSFFEENLTEAEFELLETIKSLYDYIILQEVLDGHEYISYAQIQRYDDHKKDLEKLKTLFRKYATNDEYNDFFRKSTGSSYVNYLGYYIKNNKKHTVKKTPYQEFLKNVKKNIDDFSDKSDPDYINIIQKIEEEKFLLKQISNKNFIIPNQVHKTELDKILDNLAKAYPSFNEKTEGFSKIEKIEKTFTFRIPYYLGHLNDSHRAGQGGTAWLYRQPGKEDEKIRPWNIEQVVDYQKSEDEFIRKMLNQCTYLPDQKVLPKSSLLYSEYMVYNELNSIKIRGERLDVDIKNELVEDLYKKSLKVTKKSIRDYLIRNNYAESSDISDDWKGVEINANLSSYIKFKSLLGDKFDYQMVEDIIEMITIHTGNKKLLTKYINTKYPKLSDKEIKEISNFIFKDWARFSRKLLNGIIGDDLETGERSSIMGFLKSTKYNFMELLAKERFTFIEQIEEIRLGNLPKELNIDVLNSLYVSPAVRKMIWQVIKINEELIKVMGCEPTKIFIEMARGPEEVKEVKNSRKSQLLEKYKAIGKDVKELYSELKDRTDSELRSKKLFLYYSQLGKDAYTGKPIDLDHIFDSTMYDIDHIIPRRMKKDDSIINNLVLVSTRINQNEKKDMYPLPENIRKNHEVKKLWKTLLDKELISKIKYERLTRKEALSQSELADFINRQLVETRQSTKVVKELFEKYYDNSKVITVKAGLVSDLRKDFDVLKSREINDLHHAHDAFLNIIVGDVWNKKFTSNPINFVKKNYDGGRVRYTLNHIFTKNQKVRDEIIWEVDKGKRLVLDTLNKPSVLTSSETFEQTGALYNATIVGKREIKPGTDYLPLKQNDRMVDVNKYGAYKSLTGAYFFLVEHEVKGKNIKTIEYVPAYISEEVKKDNSVLDYYCREILKLYNHKVLISKINYKTEIEVNGFRYLISGRTGNRLILQPFVQKYYSTSLTNELKKLNNIYLKSVEFNKDHFSEDDRETMNKLAEYLINNLNRKPFNLRINKPNINLEILSGLDNQEMFKLINSVVSLMSKSLATVDLSSVGLAKGSGKTLISKDFTDTNYFIIYKSITGIFENRKRI